MIRSSRLVSWDTVSGPGGGPPLPVALPVDGAAAARAGGLRSFSWNSKKPGVCVAVYRRGKWAQAETAWKSRAQGFNQKAEARLVVLVRHFVLVEGVNLDLL